MYNELTPKYREEGRHGNFVEVFRLGPRKRDSCERAFIELKDRPFSLRTALMFFKAQAMSFKEGDDMLSTTVDLMPPKDSPDRKEFQDTLKGHYLWKKDYLEAREPIVSDTDYQHRKAYFIPFKSENRMASMMSKLLNDNLAKSRQALASYNKVQDNYLNNLISRVVAK